MNDIYTTSGAFGELGHPDPYIAQKGVGEINGALGAPSASFFGDIENEEDFVLINKAFFTIEEWDDKNTLSASSVKKSVGEKVRKGSLSYVLSREIPPHYRVSTSQTSKTVFDYFLAKSRVRSEHLGDVKISSHSRNEMTLSLGDLIIYGVSCIVYQKNDDNGFAVKRIDTSKVIPVHDRFGEPEGIVVKHEDSFVAEFKGATIVFDKHGNFVNISSNKDSGFVISHSQHEIFSKSFFDADKSLSESHALLDILSKHYSIPSIITTGFMAGGSEEEKNEIIKKYSEISQVISRIGGSASIPSQVAVDKATEKAQILTPEINYLHSTNNPQAVDPSRHYARIALITGVPLSVFGENSTGGSVASEVYSQQEKNAPDFSVFWKDLGEELGVIFSTAGDAPLNSAGDTFQKIASSLEGIDNGKKIDILQAMNILSEAQAKNIKGEEVKTSSVIDILSKVSTEAFEESESGDDNGDDVTG